MIYVIGIGPGDKRLMTGEALQAIEDAEVIVGYVTYIKLIKELIKDKEVVKQACAAKSIVAKKPLILH